MAGFNAKALRKVGMTFVGANDVNTKWLYVTADAQATVETSNYFTDNRLKKGDLIEVVFLRDGTPGSIVKVVTAVNAAHQASIANQLAGSTGISGGQTAITDSGGGTAGAAVAAGVGVYVLPVYVQLANILGNADVLTNYVVGHRFKVLAMDFAVEAIVTTSAKRADFNLEIGSTNVTGGVVSVLSAAADAAGKIIAGSAVSGDNVGAANATLSIEAASVTAHAEGSGWLLVKIQNLDTADAFASILDRLVDAGVLAAA